MSRKLLTGADLSNQKIINLADGTAATDAVTKQQLDAAIRGLDWKQSVRAASTTNVTLASPGASMDGVTLASGDRVLLKDQSTASQNGIYTWSAAGSALVRATDADSNAEVTGGMAVTVTEGTVNADRMYVLTTNDAIVVDTTALAFAQLGGGGATYSAGNGLQNASNTFSILLDSGSGLLVAGTGLKIDPAYTGLAKRFSQDVATTATSTVTHNLGSSDVVVAVRDKTTGEFVECDVFVASANTVTLTFATAPTTGQYRVTVVA